MAAFRFPIVRRLKDLESENGKLKKLLAETASIMLA